jgi:baculoviral IAP repeat-containing protein 7/8
MCDKNISSQTQAEKLEKLHVKSKHVEMQDYKTRFATFANWPSIILTPTPAKLAEAGFFYCGQGDVTICYHCGSMISGWKPVSDPWVEHARWFGYMCGFVEVMKGMDYIDQHFELITFSSKQPVSFDAFLRKSVELS